MKLGRNRWSYWKEEKDCSTEEKAEANAREIQVNEIVLDCEEMSRLSEIKRKLNEDKFYYRIYGTGSRGFHVHMNFPDFEKLPKNTRKDKKNSKIS